MGEAFQDASRIYTERDGFAPARLGGAVNVKWGAFAHTDLSAKKLFTLPAGAQIVGWIVAPTADFDGTTPVLDLGDGVTGDRFAADLALANDTDVITAGFDGAALFTALAEDTDVYATYADGGGGSAGAAVVGALYALVDES
ncbi:MAG: hypothetical protein M5R40_06560 [Anaerolineae bacterium]|nr:hypothetical protein [Anaerolineae bacterium]